VAVNDVKKRLREVVDAGAQAQQHVKDVGGGKLIASVKDADGNITGLVQSPWIQPAKLSELVIVRHRTLGG